MKKHSILLIFGIWLALAACKKTDETIPTLSFAQQVEVLESAGKAMITLTLSESTSKEVSLTISTIEGTAVSGSDYVAIDKQSIVFAPGEKSKTVSVTLVDDDQYETDEYFFVVSGSVRNAKLGNDRTKVIILNDDLFIPVLQVPERIFVEEGTLVQQIARITFQLSGPAQVPVTLNWSAIQGTAKAGEDYVPRINQTLTFNPGETEKILEVPIVNDDIFEMDDQFTIAISNLTHATAPNLNTKVIILNDDSYTPEMATDGPVTPMSYPQMYLTWSDEFDGSAVNTENWGYNTGGGGWGNNELQIYTNTSTNSYVQDGKLHITATKINNTYFSARLITQGKREFKYGRIDIRAKMPIGRGIWPALWMLGANFSTVGWPRCGEIDIMEYLGHEPKKVHGSIHYFDGGHKSRTMSYSLTSNESFNDKFHIFSIVWQENAIRWYVDYQLYHEIKDTDIRFESFRLPQFFIFNVAVGGNWPGNPDATTVFPQTMMVDYVRVFQVPEN
ncbi:MAG TPA: family 16 glycosylhydrolase [Bacteroidales bacterium]|nr:family 16 glycosylhydrolase [Bacteroidales bacterium]